jgi:uncharacterized membrane protein
LFEYITMFNYSEYYGGAVVTTESTHKQSSKLPMIVGILVILIVVVILISVIIVSSYILSDINGTTTTCAEDENIKAAHKKTAWVVGLSSAALGMMVLLAIVAVLGYAAYKKRDALAKVISTK